MFCNKKVPGHASPRGASRLSLSMSVERLRRNVYHIVSTQVSVRLCIVIIVILCLPHCRQHLAAHLRQHCFTTACAWHCSKCPKSYSTHADLQNHHRNYHQSGVFLCSHPECNFLGQHRADVYLHYELSHQSYRCHFADCCKTFKKIYHLKTHVRLHLGLKPYKCRWPDCAYASEDKSNAVKHIRGAHLGLPITKKEQVRERIVDERNATDYLEVDREMLTPLNGVIGGCGRGKKIGRYARSGKKVTQANNSCNS